MKMLIAVLMLIASSSLAAENRLALKLFANVPETTITVQGSDKDGSTGLGVGVEFLHPVTQRIAVGAEFDNLDRSPNVSGNFVNHVQGTVSGSVMAALALARFDLLEPSARLRPYLLVGAGLAMVRLQASAVPSPGFAWVTGGNADKTLVDDSQLAGVFTIRGGADLQLTQSLSLGGEFGLVRTTSVTHTLTADGQALFGKGATVSGPEATLVVGTSLAYRF